VLVRHLDHKPAPASSRTTTQLTSTPKHSSPPQPLTVGLAQCSFVDHAATTEDFATQQSVPGRTLVTEIRYPAVGSRAPGEHPGAPPASRSPRPWLVFAPGFDTSPDTYKTLLDAWVRKGFVVVSPTFPDTNPRTIAAEHSFASAEDDIVNEPADVAFVARQALAASAGKAGSVCPSLRGLLDPKALALAGQSDGATVVAALAYGSAYRSLGAGLPVKAVAAMSGEELFGNGNTYSHKAGDPALLVIQSDSDACNPPQNSVLLDLYVANPASWFLQLFHVPHLAPYTGAAPAAFQAVASTSSQFFAAELAGHEPPPGFGSSLPARVAKLTAGSPPTGLPAVQPSSAACFSAATPPTSVP
jgi:hypothetical protein